MTANALIHSIAAGLLMAPVAAGVAGVPYSFDSTPGRLPKNVVPVDYTIDITPDAQALTILGHESVLLEVRAATATIQFDSLNESLTHVRFDGRPVKGTVTDNDRQLTTVTLAAPARAGRHTLTFAYSGRVERGGAQGLFRQEYRLPDGSTARMLSTQFEATDARRMFPCWDEPAFRATFQLRVTAPAAWTAVSNMPAVSRRVAGNAATTTFARTPKMSSYLVELTVGDLARIGIEADGVQLNVWAPRGREHEGDWSLTNTRQIVADYGEYFGYPFPLPKLDSIAIPGGFSGAMENWGAITYMDALLLLSPNSTLTERQTVFSVQAHELAHQWFGDLVTLAWWDEEWLNESMTFWLERRETALRHPEWHWWELRDKDKEVAMRADAQANSDAIHAHVTDELAAAGSYDQNMVGGKGQTVMRMFEAYVGPERFRAGLRAYMKARALSNATATDLWNALSGASGQDLAALAGPWAEQPGFPLVSVTTHCDAGGTRTLSLTQRRFLLSGEDRSALRWSVPLRIRSGVAAEPQSVLLTADGQVVAAGRCGDALSVNADALGYFRASYDAPTLASNSRDFASLPVGDKIALLDDQWALVEAGSADLATYLALAGSMGASLDTRPWQQIEAALGTIERAERGKPGHDAFTAYARRILQAPFARLGWDANADETPDVQQLRRALIGDLGAWSDAEVLAEARKRYTAFLADRRSVATDDQGVLLGVIAHHADAATFEQLYALAKGTSDPSEMMRFYQALMMVDDDPLASRAAAIAVSDDLPPQAAALRLSLVAVLSREHGRISWQTFTGNATRVLEALGAQANIVTTQFVPQAYGDTIPLPELEAWMRSRVPAELAPLIDRGLETVRVDLARQAMLVRAADGFLRKSP